MGSPERIQEYSDGDPGGHGIQGSVEITGTAVSASVVNHGHPGQCLSFDILPKMLHVMINFRRNYSRRL